jgi:glycosyltransferase involved in cell wall biosynthesis/SAM-dependent methyltransferase
MAPLGRALLFGSYDARLHPRVAVLRDGLRTHGWAVTELNAPLGLSTAEKVEAAGSARGAARLAAATGRAWISLIARRITAGSPEVVVVGYMGHLDVHLARLLFCRRTVVLDHLVGLADTTRDRGLGGGPKGRLLELVDSCALRAADIVVVDTPEQAAQLPEREQVKAVVVPVGATGEWTSVRQDEPTRHLDPADSGRPLRVVFFGLYTPLQGAPVIGAAISLLRHRDDIRFTMVGTGQDLATTRSAAGDTADRVEWIDWVDADRLPEVVADHDVCLGIFGTSVKAQRVVPTKVYQGMAAGCAVVTADTPATVATLGEVAVLVPSGDPPALAKALEELADDRAVLHDRQRRCRAAAERFRPGPATTPLHQRLTAGAQARRGALPPLTVNAWLRWDLIRRELERLPATDVVEIGPGEGAVAVRLARHRRYTGVELSERTRAVTEAALRRAGVAGQVVAELDDLDADERFGLLCAFEVIEHIEDDDGALREWFGRIRPGGTIILSTPAGAHQMGPWDRIAGHYRRYDPGPLAAQLEAAGFTLVRVRRYGFPLGSLTEAIRNRVARRRLAADSSFDSHDPDSHERAAYTEQSSSYLQPPQWAALATRVGSAPGRLVQRPLPQCGPGLVAVAVVPR